MLLFKQCKYYKQYKQRTSSLKRGATSISDGIFLKEKHPYFKKLKREEKNPQLKVLYLLCNYMHILAHFGDWKKTDTKSFLI